MNIKRIIKYVFIGVAFLFATFLNFICFPNSVMAASTISYSFANYEKKTDDVFEVPVYFNLSDTAPLSVGCGKQNALFNIAFNPSILKAQSVSSGDYGLIEQQIDNSTGTITGKTVMYESTSGCSGQLLSGNIAIIMFRVINEGQSNLNFLSSGNSYYYYEPVGNGYSKRIDVPVSFSNGLLLNPSSVVLPLNTSESPPAVATLPPTTSQPQVLTKQNVSQAPAESQEGIVDIGDEQGTPSNEPAVEGATTQERQKFWWGYYVIGAVVMLGALSGSFLLGRKLKK